MAGPYTGGQAAQLIAALHAQGWSNAQIGRAVGRDSSLIRQAAQGRKPVHNLVPGLSELYGRGQAPARGQTVRPVGQAPARRTTLTGAPARVRGRPEQLPGGRYYETRTGQRTLMRELQRAAQEGKHVQFSVQFERARKYGATTQAGEPLYQRHAEVSLFSKNGMDAGALVQRINNPQAGDTWAPGDVYGALEGLANKVDSVDYAHGVERVEMLSFTSAVPAGV